MLAQIRRTRLISPALKGGALRRIGVNPHIVTDEVIITDTQIVHVKERHPQDYERYAAYIPHMLMQPDYILEANHPHTAFVLKTFEVDDVRFQLILRLVTSVDPQGYSNSVITFLKISEKKWNKYLRNKKVLYSRIDTDV